MKQRETARQTQRGRVRQRDNEIERQTACRKRVHETERDRGIDGDKDRER